jgi:hypothetical protein
MTFTMRSLLPFVATLVLAAAPGLAQEPASRAEEHAQKQQKKAGAAHPEPRNWIEQRILDIENGGGFGTPRGVMATFGDIKKGSGLAPGVAFGKLFNNGSVALVKGVYSLRNFKLAHLSFAPPPLAGGRLRFSSRVRWQDAPSLAFYALGTPSPTTRADYAETKTEVSAAATFRPARALRFGGSIGFERFETGPPDPARPRIETLFTDVPGLNADPDYLHTSVSAAIDSRDGAGYSRNGSLLRATLHDYRQQNDGPYSFRRVDAAAEQLIPILHGNWVLYAGLRASTTTAASGHEVPFFLMPDLGGGSDLRGYGNYRFRDRHSLIFTAEYRWYAQEFVDMAIFYDAGKAVARRADLDFSGLKSDVGLGIRFHGPQTTVLRLEVARGSEGLHFIFSFSPVGG